VRAVIEYIMTLMRFEADERHIRLEQSVEESLPPVFGDDTQVSQVLINVIVNSFHAMPTGGLCRITAGLGRHGGNPCVNISVSDTGSGIPKEIIDKIAQVIAKAVKEPKFAAQLAEYGVDPLGSTPDEYKAMLARDIAIWAEAVEIAGVKQ